MNKDIKIGDKYKSRNGLVGEVVKLNGVPRLEVRNALGRITQTILLRKIDLSGFKKLEVEKEGT
ncbi:MAG: hypothetical protein KAI79_12230 [Bacteroidales bacterium]|nr:hypothetical protein [Bacteroidales bacterium]